MVLLNQGLESFVIQALSFLDPKIQNPNICSPTNERYSKITMKNLYHSIMWIVGAQGNLARKIFKCVYLSFFIITKEILESESLLLFKLNQFIVLGKKRNPGDHESSLKIFLAKLFLARCPCASPSSAIWQITKYLRGNFLQNLLDA